MAPRLGLRVAVIDDYQRVAHELGDWASLGDDVRVESFDDHLFDEDALAARLAPFDVVVGMRERTPFPRSLLMRLPKLRLLAMTGRRHPGLDFATCAERGIVVSTTGTGEGTAELAWALILGVVRSIAQEDKALREGRWQTKLGVELAGQTLGILGLGHLGKQMARFGQTFGMNVIAWSQNLTPEAAAEGGARFVGKDELLALADVLTIHLVLSERTRGIVGATDIARMKPTAYLVNTSRAPLVDQDALVSALHRGKIAGAALDVFDQEPLAPDNPILRAPNTLLTPHIGYVTRRTYEIFFHDLVEDIRAWRDGKPVRVVTQ